MKVLALLLLLGADDAFIQGYATAVLEREFSLSDIKVEVRDGVITLGGSNLKAADSEKISAALGKIPGVRTVVFSEEQPAKGRPTDPQAGKGGWSFLPDGRLFAPLLADPTWPHFSAAYRLHPDSDEIVRHAGVVSFGESIDLAGWDTVTAGKFGFGIEASVVAEFDLDSSSVDLINADYRIGIPVSYAVRRLSAQARLFHQSSHLGDELLLFRTPVARVNYTYEAVDLRVSYAPEPFRVYVGGGYLVHREPDDLKPGWIQAGIEFRSRTDFLGSGMLPVAAVDVQRHQETAEWIDTSVRVGMEFENPWQGKRRAAILLEYYRGHNPNGQFYDLYSEFYGVGLHIYF